MRDNILKIIDNKLAEIDKIEDSVVYTNKVTTFLDTLHPSDAYAIIRDKVIPAKNKRIQMCRHENLETYQTFQDLKQRCKASFDHDRSWATNLDVDKAVSKAYGIAMRTLRANMDMEKVRFDKITSAINRIEEHLGLDVTDFREDEANDTAEHENAQGIKETVTGTGEAGKTE